MNEKPLCEAPDGETVRFNDLLKRRDVLTAIDAEPELPGDMPPPMWIALKELVAKDDQEGMTEALRILVRVTKAAIAERVNAL